MNSDSTTLRAWQLPAVRPARQAVAEVLGMSAIALSSMVAIGVVIGGVDGYDPVLSWAANAGESVLEHIGWGFGVYIPTMLGLYAIVIGGQLVADEATAWRVRRILGFVAEVMAALFAPAVLLAVIACARTPAHIGALFVIIPVTAVMFFLAIQLGGFVAFEPHRRLAAAHRTAAWATQRLGELAVRTRKPVSVVAIVNIAAATTLGMTGFALAGSTSAPGSRTGWDEAVLLALSGCCVTFASMYAGSLAGIARDRGVQVAGWGMFAVVSVMFAGTAVILLRSPSTAAGGAALLITVGVITASTVWPRPGQFTLTRDWTLRPAATTLAARTVTDSHRKAIREIQELAEPEMAADAGPFQFAGRVRAALRAFVAG